MWGFSWISKRKARIGLPQHVSTGAIQCQEIWVLSNYCWIFWPILLQLWLYAILLTLHFAFDKHYCFFDTHSKKRILGQNNWIRIDPDAKKTIITLLDSDRPFSLSVPLSQSSPFFAWSTLKKSSQNWIPLSRLSSCDGAVVKDQYMFLIYFWLGEYRTPRCQNTWIFCPLLFTGWGGGGHTQAAPDLSHASSCYRSGVRCKSILGYIFRIIETSFFLFFLVHYWNV